MENVAKKYEQVNKSVNVYNATETILYQKILKLGDEAPITDWFKELASDYTNGVSNVFFIHGNIKDYVVPEYKLEDYLILQLSNYLGIDEVAISRFCMTNNFENYHYQTTSDWWSPKTANRELVSRLVTGIKETGTRRALFIYYPELLLPNEYGNTRDEDLCNIALFDSLISSKELATNDNIIIFISESKAHVTKKITESDLVTSIFVGYPNDRERIAMINHLYDNYKLNVEEGFSLMNFASISGGLTRKSIEDIWLSSIEDGVLTKQSVIDKKNKKVRDTFGDKLEICEPNENYSLSLYGGMEYIKDYLQTGIIEPINNGEFDVVPKGLLFMGVPGSGKTYLAKCIASSSGIAFVSLNIGSLNAKYVGESEENLEKALDCIKSLMPCFVFIDEIDETLRRSSPDESNAVRGNIFKRLMEFMSDPTLRGKVIFIGACNHPSVLDDALKRAGRFDVKIPFTALYDDNDRAAVLNIHLQKNNFHLDTFASSYRETLEKTKGYTHAEIEAVVIKAVSLARRRKINLNGDLLVEACGYIKRMDNENIEAMTKEAIDNCNDLEFVSSSALNYFYNR